MDLLPTGTAFGCVIRWCKFLHSLVYVDQTVGVCVWVGARLARSDGEAVVQVDVAVPKGITEILAGLQCFPAAEWKGDGSYGYLTVFVPCV